MEDGIIVIAPRADPGRSKESIIVHFIEEKKAIGQKRIEDISSKMKANNIYNGIIVSNANLAPSAEKV